MAAQALQNSKIAVPKLWRVPVRSSRLHTQGSRDIFSNLFPYSLFVDHESNQDTPCPFGQQRQIQALRCGDSARHDSGVTKCSSDVRFLTEGAAVLLLLLRGDAGQVPPGEDAKATPASADGSWLSPSGQGTDTLACARHRALTSVPGVGMEQVDRSDGRPSGLSGARGHSATQADGRSCDARRCLHCFTEHPRT